MGPKKGKKEKKGGGSKKARAAAADENDPSKENEAERVELVRQAKTLLEMAKKEEQAFNEFQQQREKINYFWIVEKKNFEDRKAELRNKERERQDLEEKHQVEIKVGCSAFVASVVVRARGRQGLLTARRARLLRAGLQAAREALAVRAPERRHRAQERCVDA